MVDNSKIDEKRQEFLEVVYEDLEYLNKAWGNDVSDDTLRRDSAVLRRLLIYKDLKKAWKFVGFEGQPMIKAPSLKKLIPYYPNIIFAQAGGAIFKGLEARQAVIHNLPMLDLFSLGAPEDDDLNVDKFIKSPCIIIGSIPITRDKLIRYVSNKLGSAHFDPSRTREYALIEGIQRRFIIVNKFSIYYELLSVGQALSHSSDIKKLKEAISQEIKNAKKVIQ